MKNETLLIAVIIALLVIVVFQTMQLVAITNRIQVMGMYGYMDEEAAGGYTVANQLATQQGGC